MICSLAVILILTAMIVSNTRAEEDETYYFMHYSGRTFDMERKNLADIRLRLDKKWSFFWSSSYYMTIKTKWDHRISLLMESVDDDGCDARVSLYSNAVSYSNELARDLCTESDYSDEYITSNRTLVIKYWASFWASENNFEFIITSIYKLTPGDENKCPNGTSFNCGNQRCINESLVCNYRDNCGNYLDEEECDLWLFPVIISVIVVVSVACICCVIICCCKSKKKEDQRRKMNQSRVSPQPPYPTAVTYHTRPGVQQGVSPPTQPSQSVYIHQAPGVYVPGQYPPSPPQTRYPGNQSAQSGMGGQHPTPGQPRPIRVVEYPPAPTAGYQQQSSGYHNSPGQIPVYQASPGQSPSGNQASPGRSPSGYQASPGQSPSGYQPFQGQSPSGYQAYPGQSPSAYNTSGNQEQPPGYNATPGSPITPRAPPPAVEGYTFAPTFVSSAQQERKGGI